MNLIIYKKGDNLYSLFCERTPKVQKFLNEDFKVVKLFRRNVIDAVEINSFEDLKAHRDVLDKYKFKIFVIEQRQPEFTEIILRLDILNNMFYSSLMAKFEERNENEENKVPVRVMEINNYKDWQECEKEFGFNCDFGKRIFDFEEENGIMKS